MPQALTVLQIDDNPARADIVAAGLRAGGHRLLCRLDSTRDLDSRVAEWQPDVIVIAVDSPGPDTIENLRRSNQARSRPIALFTDSAEPGTIAAAMEAGVCACVVNGLAEVRVKPVIDVAVAHFNRYRGISEELERARLSLLERKAVDRAKALLMKQRSLTEEAAYHCMRKLAMDQNKRIGEVAQELLTYAPVLK